MKKSKKMIIGLVLLAIGVVGIFSLFGEFSSELLLGSILTMAGGVVLIWLDKKVKPTADEPPLVTQTPINNEPKPAEPQKAEVPDGEKDYDLLPHYADGKFLCYEYEEKIYFIKDDNIDEKFGYIIGNGGKQLLFEFEPENEYDSFAVAIYLDGKKLGYVYQGQTQDMIHSYHRKGWEICAHLNKYSKEEKTASYKIGFYKPKECLESKQFTLVKTTKRIDEYSNRADNLCACDEGELLFIEKEFLEDNYIVTTDTYDEIGELPKSAINFIEENCPKKIYGIFDSWEYDENGKAKGKITVYLT